MCSYLNHRGSAVTRRIKCPPCHRLASSPWPRRQSCLHHTGNVLPGPGQQLGMGHVRASLHHSTSYWASQLTAPEQHTASQVAACHPLLFCSKAPPAAQNRPASARLFPYKCLLIGLPQVASGNEEPLGWWTRMPESLPDCLQQGRRDEKFQENVSNENMFHIHNEQWFKAVLNLFFNYIKWPSYTLLAYIPSAFFFPVTQRKKNNQGLFAVYPLISLKSNTSYHALGCNRFAVYMYFPENFQQNSLCWLQELLSINSF